MTQNQTNAVVEAIAADSLDWYTREIKDYQILSAEDEYAYAVRFKNNNDLAAAKELIVAHLRLVSSVARSLSGYNLPQSDLIQEGNIGLMKAVKNFDPDRGTRLVSFAMLWIKSEMHEYIIRNWRMVKIATTHAQRKLFFNLRQMRTGFESLTSSEIHEIARKLDVRPEEVRSMEARMNGQEISIEDHSEDDENYISPIANLTDGGMSPEEALEFRQNEAAKTAGLSQALSILDPRSRRVIEARWLKEEGAAVSTLSDLASEFSISSERIRQIESKAMATMKQVMLAY